MTPARHPAPTARRRNKFRNVPTVVDGIRFASKAEAKRWGELKLLEKAGEIHNLKRQPRFKLQFHSNDPICTYVGDFSYLIHEDRPQAIVQRCVVEDVKGVETPAFKLKAKLFRACYPGIELRVVKA